MILQNFSKHLRSPGLFHLLILHLAVLLCAFQAVAQTNFATLTIDGGWCWFSDPRALFHNGKLYYGYVKPSTGKAALDVFDLSTGKTTNLWYSGFTQTDDHDVPGLCVKDDGTMLAIYSRHLADYYFAYRTSNSTNPGTPADWNAEQQIPNSADKMTYANPFQLTSEGGKIYNFCRNLNFNPTIYTSTDNGSTWSSPEILIQSGSGGVRPYVKYCSDGIQRIDFLYTDGHPRDVANSLYHMFYQGGSFYTTDGTLIKSYANLPLDHDAGERGSVIYQYSDASQSDPNQWIPTGRAWCWEIARDTNGYPFCVFQVQVGTDATWSTSRIFYYYARWTGTEWQKRFIAQAGRALYAAESDYAGGICLDPKDPNVIYMSSNAQNPFDLTTTANVPLGSHYEIWKGITTDGGLSFNWQAVTTNSTVDNCRPYIPRRYGGEPCVLWWRGTYNSYTSFSSSIVGLFTTAVPTNTVSTNASAKISYIDATSGNGGNTVLAATGGTFAPSASASGTDGLWRVRAFGNNATIFESGGDTSTAGSAVNGNNEDAPRLATTLTNLVPGASYDVYAYFWGTTDSSDDWRIRAGLTNTIGDLNLHSTALDPSALADNFTTAPLLVEGNRILHQAALGRTVASLSGTITLFVDDDPASRSGISNGWNFRSWYDGAGYSLAINPNPTNLNITMSGTKLTLSWPASHLGWILQSQTNSLASGLSTNWHDIVSSSSQTQESINISPNNAVTLFRLRYP